MTQYIQYCNRTETKLDIMLRVNTHFKSYRAFSICFSSAISCTHSHFLPDSYLHQVRCHQTPAAHEVEQWAGFTPYDSEHGITKTKQVKCASPVLGRFYFTYKEVKANKWKLTNSCSSISGCLKRNLNLVRN